VRLAVRQSRLNSRRALPPKIDQQRRQLRKALEQALGFRAAVQLDISDDHVEALLLRALRGFEHGVLLPTPALAPKKIVSRPRVRARPRPARVPATDPGRDGRRSSPHYRAHLAPAGRSATAS